MAKNKRKAVKLKNIAQRIEINDLFNEEIGKLSKKEKITELDLCNLRKNISDRGLPKMSDFWNPFLRIKIKYPKFDLSKHLAGAVSVTQTLDEYSGEIHYSIDEYPETNQDDVKRAHSAIRNLYNEKKKTQKYNNLEVAELIYDLSKIGYSDRDIAKMIEGPNYDYSNIGRIRRTYLKRKQKGS